MPPKFKVGDVIMPRDDFAQFVRVAYRDFEIFHARTGLKILEMDEKNCVLKYADGQVHCDISLLACFRLLNDAEKVLYGF